MNSKSLSITAADGLFPPADPFDAGLLAVTGGHRIAYSQRGAPDGIPAVVLHGGPGSGSSPFQARFFDPGRYRVIQFDQRGSGQSQPAGETRHNRTGLLLEDIEALRRHLGIARWLVVGGSWGATLGAVYAAAHRPVVSGALLRGLFLTGGDDFNWFFRDAAAFHPEAWEALVQVAPPWARGDLLPWLCKVFAGQDQVLQVRTACAWFAWERVLSGLPPALAPEGEALRALCLRYRVQSHYLAHRCWLGKSRVLQACAALRGLPLLFLHGSVDAVCRPVSAWQAHRACLGSRLAWAEGAGHDPYHPAMAAAMVGALNGYAATGSFGQ